MTMRLLLDTHAFLWWLSDWEQIAESTREAIADPDNEVFVSAVSGWEIAIKKARGRLAAPSNLAAVVEDRGFTHLPLTFEQAERTAALPNHHRDPFDRGLVSQAILNGMTIVTPDEAIARYPAPVLW